VAAPLQLDGVTFNSIVRGQTISPVELPEYARKYYTNDVDLRMSIAEVEQLARQCGPGDVAKLQPPGAQELVALMNWEGKRNGSGNGHVQHLYWGISPVTLDGVVEQVRTTLTVMIAEIRANTSGDVDIPPAKVATDAINVAVSGKRNKVSFAATQAGNDVSPEPEPEEVGVIS
jgi:hypothetical protein